MEINKIYLYSNSNSNVKTSKKETDNITSPYREMREYPKNFVPYFGARLNRTPESFYDFNQENMPVTVRNYLNEDLQNRGQIAPFLLQQQAFENLSLAKNIDNVKELYPNENLFQNLKTLNDINPRNGYLYFLCSSFNGENTNILKTGEDLTVYLLKKIYLDGCSLDEINEAFDNDVEDEYKYNNVPEKHKNNEENKYFDYSTLKTLGIEFPKKSYWKSLRATREECYEFINRTSTPESRANRSRIMSEYWLSLIPEEKQARIDKMRNMNDPDFRTFAEFQSPIMVFAAAEINLSDKLSDFLQQKFNETEYVADFSDLTGKMQTFLSAFWEENPELKDDFSKAIKNSIKMFQDAQETSESAVKTLYHTADMIQNINKQKGFLRKQEAEMAKRAEELNLQAEENKVMEELLEEENKKLEQKHAILKKQEENLNSKNQDLLNKEKTLNIKEQSLNRKNAVLNHQRLYLSDKETELKQREKMLMMKEKQLESQQESLDKSKKDLEIQKKEFEQKQAEFERNRQLSSKPIQQSQKTTEQDNQISMKDKRELVISCFAESLHDKSPFCPDEYLEAFYNYVINDKSFDEKIVNNLFDAFILNKGKDVKKSAEYFASLTEKFRNENKKLAIALDIVLAQYVYNFTNDSKILTTKNVLAYLERHEDIAKKLIPYKQEMSEKLLNYVSEITKDGIDELFDIFSKHITRITEKKCYLTLNSDDILSRLSRQNKKLKAVLKNVDNRNKFKNFIKDYSGVLRYANSNDIPHNPNKQDESKLIRIYLVESIIDDYLEYCEKEK